MLTKGVLDNGRGLARLNVFRHKHEIESGRTSSISQEILGFDSRGSIVNYGAVKVGACLVCLFGLFVWLVFVCWGGFVCLV